MALIVLTTVLVLAVAGRIWATVEMARWQPNDPRIDQLLRRALA